MYYGRRHQYIYYPIAWVDSLSGQTYLPGYYDENGNHYGNVAFKEGDKYKNVICKCDYCDSQITMDMTEKQSQELECPNCGAPMKVLSTLDEMENNAAAAGNGGGYGNSGAYGSGSTVRSSGIRRFVFIALLIIAVLFVIGFINRAVSSVVNSYSQAVQYGDNSGYGTGYSDGTGSSGYGDYGTDTYDDGSGYPAGVSNIDLFGRTIYLDKTGEGTYVISDDGNASYDKMISWEASYDSYYDPETDCYIWYNNDVTPGIWQYWYEGISSGYEPSGWMEYDESGVWYIEQDYGDWFELPQSDYAYYLWHIEEQGTAGGNSGSTGTDGSTNSNGSTSSDGSTGSGDAENVLPLD